MFKGIIGIIIKEVNLDIIIFKYIKYKEVNNLDIDTIAAIATAPGEAGIGIVRISGKNSINIIDKIFIGKENISFKNREPRKLYYGHIINPENEKVIDEVLTVYMKAPYTYTTEDIIEINCHGGIIPVRKILEIILQNEARIAEPGEFTKRAFMNGRIDLAQAEAVMDLISAKTDSSFDVSLNQLEGSLSNEVKLLRESVLKMLAQIEATIDFPDEDDVEDMAYEKMKEEGNNILERINKLLSTVYTGKILKEGLKTIILGKPNVGKSSLMNAILRENRAIVTEIPGTTRDIIEEYVNINGIPLRIVDTAGIRETEDLVEKIGVDRAKSLIDKGDLAIVVFDASEDLADEDMIIIEMVKNKKSIILLNKTDLEIKTNENIIKRYLPNKEIINTSMIKGKGLETLENTIKDMFFKGEVKVTDDIIVNNVRHKDLLIKAKNNIKEALNSIEMGMPIDCIEVDVKECWNNLGEINGYTVGEDIIDRIFSDFCIGK
ncbi:tRNA uridine-5-carboxymethylaminomethyl(34) synthesis GTPase MnmE [Clostridium sp. D2Q-14]|uniref:tRNA uridine-5-carboxymethylaminomethyl(34) synthesis GTPase MnmE n=1 Tax=Anaeromonas gelatinilytica TaxID=2683194 RepID=UPI00193C6983|nr:tRNA uridine-5-carboxymethylaminomethyl(34) synthesis GTPase MnmE [Anaeromonas gelatinilytica]MBS4534952.1 tRNA uridine-5-carboxymethylaminomethyl(34) synthesis GTPase MnmE [Anaeromonas gelatinilytica]